MNTINNYHYIAAVLIALLVCTGASPQTKHHDAAVMNQFTAAETGVGNLGPTTISDAYYTSLHKRYRQSSSSPEFSKQFWRTVYANAINKEGPMAEQIDSALTARAKIEALNIADRSIDLAWQAEKEKIQNKQALFKKNINQILFRGGTNQDYKYWMGIYNAVDCGLRTVKDAYLPNSQRKKQYLLIYKDLVQYNNQLVDCICVWAGLKQAANYSEGKVTRQPKPGDIARSAYGRWKIAMAGGGGIAGGSGGGVSGGGISTE